MEKQLNQIAKEILHLETLETRKSDSLDFSEQAVWTIKAALEAAFRAGAAQQADTRSVSGALENAFRAGRKA